MLLFLGKRLLQLIPTLFFVSVIIFGLQQLLPGDPALAMAGEERDPAVLEQIRRQYRLDQPLYVQYLYWVGGVLVGQSGRVDAPQGAGAHADRAEVPGHPAAGADGDRHLAHDRRDAPASISAVKQGHAPSTTPSTSSRCGASRRRTSGSASC